MKIILFVCFGLFLIQFNITAEIKIKTIPTASKIKPDKDLVQTQVFLPKDTHYKIQIQTPKSHWLISTDFPVVEDTSLFTFEGYSKTGIVTFDTIYPIRGRYSIHVTAGSETKELSLEVNEAPSEINKMFVFLGIIFTLGLIGGQIFLRSSQAQISVKMAALILFLSFNFIYSTQISAHKGHLHKRQIEHWIGNSGNYNLDVKFDAKDAVVGKQVEFDIQVTKNGLELEQSIMLEIETFHMEDKTIMFKGRFESINGQFSEKIQFFDGAETKTIFKVFPPGQPSFLIEELIDVEGIAPPTAVILKTLGYLSFITVLGIAVGFFFIPGRALVHK